MGEAMSEIHECEGECLRDGRCQGAVRRARVEKLKPYYHDWGAFWYCETAVEDDRSKGFRVTEVAEKD